MTTSTPPETGKPGQASWTIGRLTFRPIQLAALLALVLFVTLLFVLGNRPILALRTSDVAAVAAGTLGAAPLQAAAAVTVNEQIGAPLEVFLTAFNAATRLGGPKPSVELQTSLLLVLRNGELLYVDFSSAEAGNWAFFRREDPESGRKVDSGVFSSPRLLAAAAGLAAALEYIQSRIGRGVPAGFFCSLAPVQIAAFSLWHAMPAGHRTSAHRVGLST